MTDYTNNHGSPNSTSTSSPDGSNDTDLTNISVNGSESVHTLIKTESTASDGSTFAVPKNDKPRPHICTVCTRSFARLEHLKRHERSHTKEKPFECPECTRCFARRDLLLRHQQKLHLTSTPSTRAKPVRRDSTSGVSTTSARIRKNSAATSVNVSTNNVSSTGTTGRPRANTLGHLDISGLGLLPAGAQTSPALNQATSPLGEQFNHVTRFQSLHAPGALQRRATTDSRGHSRSNSASQVTRLGLDTSTSWRNSLPTVPSETALHQLYDFSMHGPIGEHHTVNPQQLHMEDSVDSLDSPFVENFEWMGGFNSHMNFQGYDEQGMPATSPSGLSMDSPMLTMGDHSYNNAYYSQPQHMVWQQPPQQLQTPDPSLMTPDMMAHMQNDYGMPADMTSSIHQHSNLENYYPTPPPFASLSPDISHNAFSPHFQQPMAFLNDASTFSLNAAAYSPSQYQTRPTAVESLTELTRQALLVSLSQPSSSYAQRKPSSTHSASSRESSASSGSTLPSLADLQRYVSAYIQYFQPHCPFLHVATLTFDTPAYTSTLRVAHGHANGQGGIIGGGGCLILAMAAIGALYEFEAVASRDLFDQARKMIQLYLEERRKADLAAAINSSRHSDNTAQNTPLWLVQAMLLNVIYGHQCGDKVSGDIASTHCAALVSLGRAADLLSPPPEVETHNNGHVLSPGLEKIRTNDSIAFNDPWGFSASSDEDETAWRHWVNAEERKRTLYAIYNMSSLLVSGYNHAPAIMNSEILLDLPCEEEVWSAESAGVWTARGGAQLAKHKSISFASALSSLLMASQNTSYQNPMHSGAPLGSGMLMADLPPSDLRPSTFGCLVLINALHNFVWETRQRHSGARWTTQESESMQAHIEPALRAWQAAWGSNPTHSLERPNPFGMGPLSADSIPLLDLAYVRLYVNLGLSKEAFWQRDYDAMADELARGTDIIQHADYSGSQSSHSSESGSRKSSLIPGTDGYDIKMALSSAQQSEQQKISRREKQLRKAAFYAADSLSMSQKLGVTFADFTSRDLPMQSAMCVFDCAQVLAEWVTAVQERVGRYLGVMGRDAIDFTQVPAMMLLEDEDCKLLEKTRDILAHAEMKMTAELAHLDQASAMAVLNALPSCSNRGFGAQLLDITAHMLRNGRVWSVTTQMAHGLEVQAAHMQKRADHSIMLPQV